MKPTTMTVRLNATLSEFVAANVSEHEDVGANLHGDDAAFRQIDVGAAAEADEPEAFAGIQWLGRFHPADDAACDEAGDLHAGDVLTVGGAQVQRVALVLDRGLVEGGIHEAVMGAGNFVGPGIGAGPETPIAVESLNIAGDICIYTNHNLVIEKPAK